LIGLTMTTDPLFGKGNWRDTELEKDFQERVCHLARLYHWRIYSVPDSRRVSLAGYPDLTMWNVEQKRLVFAELKREKGRISESQKIVLSELQTLVYCEVYVWRPSDWDNIIQILKAKP
jgi:VRR-NUC domain